MSAPLRTSPLHDAHAARAASWTDRSGMRVPAAFSREGDPAMLGLADLSHVPRTGLKGPGAAAWLATQELPVPSEPNTWRAFARDGAGAGLVARLAVTEFLVEDEGPRVASVERALGHGLADVTSVLRQDCALALVGTRASDVLLQTCSLDFAPLLEHATPEGGPLAMTSMAGVSVLVVPQVESGRPCFRIWCDPTFGPYLYRTLLDIVAEEGGGPVGLARLARFQDPTSEAP